MTRCWCMSTLETRKPLRLDPIYIFEKKILQNQLYVTRQLKKIFQNLDNDKTEFK